MTFVKDAIAVVLLIAMVTGFVMLNNHFHRLEEECIKRGGFMHEAVCLDRNIRK